MNDIQSCLIQEEKWTVVPMFFISLRFYLVFNLHVAFDLLGTLSLSETSLGQRNKNSAVPTRKKKIPAETCCFSLGGPL